MFYVLLNILKNLGSCQDCFFLFHFFAEVTEVSGRLITGKKMSVVFFCFFGLVFFCWFFFSKPGMLGPLNLGSCIRISKSTATNRIPASFWS